MDQSLPRPPLPAHLEDLASRSPHDTLIYEETEAVARLDPPESPTSHSETGSLPSTVDLDVPSPLPLPVEDDIKAPHPQFTLLFGQLHSITMMEILGPEPNAKVDCMMQPFAVRAELNPDVWPNMSDRSLQIIVCLHDAATGAQITDEVLDGGNTIIGIQSERLDKHGQEILVYDFVILGLRILQEGRFYFTYMFIDPLDETRAFWDLKGSPCKATRRPQLCKQITIFCEPQLMPRIISGT
jgi:hypothetical protein